MGEHTKGVSRRDFLTATGVGVAAIAGLGLSGCAAEDSGQTNASADYLPASWDAETDILVVGCGGAGISAGITAANEGLGECLVCEAAPEGFEGGNTRVSAQVIFWVSSVEDAIKYQTTLNNPYPVEDALVRAWAENLCENIDWLNGLGIEPQETRAFSPEWPGMPGSETVQCYVMEGKLGFSLLWEALAEVAADLGVVIQNDTRATELVFDPISKEVFGVKAEVNGTEHYIKARKGVILSCGGFECDPDLIREYAPIGISAFNPSGTPYNRGDGIRMARKIGAQLWHMNNFSGAGLGGYSRSKEGSLAIMLSGKDYVYVGNDAKRFMYEERISLNRHGKSIIGGTGMLTPVPVPAYAIFGSGSFDAAPLYANSTLAGWNGVFELDQAMSNEDFVASGDIFKADTIEELATKLGLDPTVLAETINSYNANAQNNIDPEWKRGTAVYDALAGMSEQVGMGDSEGKSTGEIRIVIEPFPLVPLVAPYYGYELRPGLLNTQGGAKRSAKGEIVDYDGNPIPRLYGAGEFGPVYSNNYNGGGNVSEAMSSGRLAARSVATLDSWENQ
jgi:succinate dehydrogenase/fumarate reductase flavoprotein subunit